MHVSSENKIYTAGYLNEVIGDDEYYVATYRPASPPTRLTISLNPSSVTPSKSNPISPAVGNKSIVTVTAFDSENQPVSGVLIRLSTAAVPFSGGHDHNAGHRPTGTIVRSSGTTNQSGVSITTYTPSELGGYEKITAVWVDNPKVSTSTQLDVRVAKLVKMSISTTTPKAYNLTGETSNHGSNHFSTSVSTTVLAEIAIQYQNITETIVGINDMSLINGGLFDILGNWSSPHIEHRVGFNADIDRYVQRISDGLFILIECSDDEILRQVVGQVTGDPRNLICELGGRKHIRIPQHH